MIGLEHYLVLGTAVFGIGLFGTLTKRNLIVVLMSVELMFNAVNIVVVAMSRHLTPLALRNAPGSTQTEVVQTLLTGQVFAAFVITVAAAEVALALAIVILLFRNRQTSDAGQLTSMKR
jgi:NADH:ubiquinone oxidoreductase subunit K